MGKFNAGSNKIYQQLTSVLPGGVWSMPAFFNNKLYYGPVNGPIMAFQFANAVLSTTPVSQTPNAFGYPGATPSISANGNANGIVWAAENTNPAVLHAYDATDLHELYNSNQAAGGRDHFGTGNKFITPTIADGKVFVATTTGAGVFGVLGGTVPPPTFSPPPGTYTSAVRVTISDANANAKIYYTTDGTTPTPSSTLFRRPIRIATTTTIKAIAVVGGISSPVASGTYTLQ
ncbi:MAG: hypothetical protein C5B51_29315 [Terriglobia bacterium]|nr:MAG: hypothetical protein C5B51_29315 [Terriglobia bacterium]